MFTLSLILAGAVAAQEPPKMPAGDGFVGRLTGFTHWTTPPCPRLGLPKAL